MWGCLGGFGAVRLLREGTRCTGGNRTESSICNKKPTCLFKLQESLPSPAVEGAVCLVEPMTYDIGMCETANSHDAAFALNLQILQDPRENYDEDAINDILVVVFSIMTTIIDAINIIITTASTTRRRKP